MGTICNPHNIVPAKAGTLADLRGYAAPIGLQSILHAVSFARSFFAIQVDSIFVSRRDVVPVVSNR